MPEQKPQVDFAISYAGEDAEIGREIAHRLEQHRFSVFFGDDLRDRLAGTDAETLFERLFTEAKQVIVLVSRHYRDKDWPRFEWDVIQERDLGSRFIPIRLDDTKIKGLSSKFIYMRFTGTNYAEIVEACIKRLLLFENDSGLDRPTEYQRILKSIQNDSKGAMAEAYQLVKDKRQRTLLSDCDLPAEDFVPTYEVISREWTNFSTVKRLSVKITVPAGQNREEVRFNLRHCAASEFNSHKPDAVMVLAYTRNPKGTNVDGPFTVGRAVFAPFGKWEKAQDGVAYNIPTEEFEISIEFSPGYFKS